MKEKVPCERYGFYLKDNLEKWIQIDISHGLMETLELNKGEDITHPLYLDPQVLEKFLKGEHIRGAITIENEEEIFFDKPVSEKGSKRELIKRLEELEKLKKWEKTFPDENAGQVQTRINNLQTQLNTANAELAKEKGWWDKWINDDEPLFGSVTSPLPDQICILYRVDCSNMRIYEDAIFQLNNKSDEITKIGQFLRNDKTFKESIKRYCYQYYRNK